MLRKCEHGNYFSEPGRCARYCTTCQHGVKLKYSCPKCKWEKMSDLDRARYLAKQYDLPFPEIEEVND